MKKLLNWRMRRRIVIAVACLMMAAIAGVGSKYMQNNEIVVEAATGVITSKLTTGTYTLSSNETLSTYCEVSGTVVINGNGYTVTGANDLPIFKVTSGSSLTIKNLNIVYKSTGATSNPNWPDTTSSTFYAVIVNGSLTMTGGSISGGAVQGVHGSVGLETTITLNGVEIYNSGSGGIGVGTYGVVNITNCNIHDIDGDGVHFNGSGSNASTYGTVSGTTITNCTYAVIAGKGIKNGSLDVSDCTIKNCTYGICMGNDGGGNSVTISGNTIVGASTSEGNGVSVNGTNFGTITIKSNEIKNFSNGVRTNCSISLSGNKIHDNNIGVKTIAGTVSYSGGSTYDNLTYGVSLTEDGCLTFTGGSITSNSKYDIYSNGSLLQIAATATCNGTKGIYLAEDQIVRVLSALACDSGAIKLTVASSDATVGREVVVTTFASTTTATNMVYSKFALTNSYTTTKSSTLLANNAYYRSAVLRAGTGTNSSLGTIIISEEYYVDFDGTISGSNVTYSLPSTQILYWKESNTVDAGSATMYYKGSELKSFAHTGWNTKKTGTGTSYSSGDTITYSASNSTKDYTLYATWSVSANLQVKGNNQTEGSDYSISKFASGSGTLPTNSFSRTRSYTNSVYDGVAGTTETTTTEYPYTFCGWSLSSSATYKSSGVYSEGDTIDFASTFIGYLESGATISLTNGYINLPIYVVWDAYPIVTTTPIYITQSQIDGGLGPEDILEMAAVATDTEDGSLTPTFVYYDSSDLLRSITTLTSFDYTVKATDGAGNTSTQKLRIYVCPDGLYEGENVESNRSYVRFISEEYYNTFDHDLGGLYDTSIWYNDSSYAKALTEAFSNLNNENFKYSYTFTVEDMRTSKEFVTNYGPGNYTSTSNLSKYLKLLNL